MSLTVTLGCMSSGKTSELLDQASRLNSINLKALFVNHPLDTRSADEVSTGNPLLAYKERLRNITFLKVGHLVGLDVTNFHTIYIDEGQFYDDLVSAVIQFKKLGKHVHVAGLIGDYLRNPIGQVLNLLPLCDSPSSDIRFSTAYCKLCAEERQLAVPAATSYKIDSRDRSQISIGSASGPTNKYMALCGDHYNTLMAANGAIGEQ
jgi:thymidine kinase